MFMGRIRCFHPHESVRPLLNLVMSSIVNVDVISCLFVSNGKLIGQGSHRFEDMKSDHIVQSLSDDQCL